MPQVNLNRFLSLRSAKPGDVLEMENGALLVVASKKPDEGGTYMLRPLLNADESLSSGPNEEIYVSSLPTNLYSMVENGWPEKKGFIKAGGLLGIPHMPLRIKRSGESDPGFKGQAIDTYRGPAPARPATIGEAAWSNGVAVRSPDWWAQLLWALVTNEKYTGEPRHWYEDTPPEVKYAKFTHRGTRPEHRIEYRGAKYTVTQSSTGELSAFAERAITAGDVELYAAIKKGFIHKG